MSNNCKDCGKEIIITDEGEITNGKQLKYLDGGKEILIFKCEECFNKSQELNNYKKTEVYSRCCGYYRPIQNFNKGIRRQYEERVEFREVDPTETPDEIEIIK